MSGPLLRLEDLRVRFHTDQGVVRAVNGASLDVERGETVALVGESGCGKTVAALALLGLVPRPPGEIAAGRIEFGGEDLTTAGEGRLREIRGSDIAMVFQEPMTSLNPVFSVGDQIAEVLVVHRGASAAQARARAVELLAQVGIPAPEQRVDAYPHQLSGGMRQRVMIAMALACGPRLLIADEPTTALDVTVQAQILDLLRELQRELGMAILLITHDLGVVAELAHRVAVMYAGCVVERAPVEQLFARPRHPYTAGLLHSRPRLDAGPETGADAAGEALAPIPGSVPDALALPPGCSFHPRCSFAGARCRREAPPLRERGPGGHGSACWLLDERPEVDLLARRPAEREPA